MIINQLYLTALRRKLEKVEINPLLSIINKRKGGGEEFVRGKRSGDGRFGLAGADKQEIHTQSIVT